MHMTAAMTTGGRLVYQYVKKAASHPTCAVSGARLNGVSLASWSSVSIQQRAAWG